LPKFTIAAKVSKGSENKILPEITGKILSDVSLELTSMSLIPVENRQSDKAPEGTVLGYRDYEPGSTVKYGERVVISVSSG
jgi:beta-lactam-binding protein with PASTA domain